MEPISAHPARRRLSEREAAAYLGAEVSPRTLQGWRNRCVGPAYSKICGRIAYDVADLDAFLASTRVEPKQAAA